MENKANSNLFIPFSEDLNLSVLPEENSNRENTNIISFSTNDIDDKISLKDNHVTKRRKTSKRLENNLTQVLTTCNNISNIDIMPELTEELETNRRNKKLPKKEENSKKHMLIIGDSIIKETCA